MQVKKSLIVKICFIYAKILVLKLFFDVMHSADMGGEAFKFEKGEAGGNLGSGERRGECDLVDVGGGRGEKVINL